MTKKYLYALVICLTILAVTLPKVLSSKNPLCNYNPTAYQGLELTKLAQELSNTGLIGRIHGAASPSQMFVLSVREPDNFFSHREFSLVTSDRKNQEIFNQLNRHDSVCIQGEFLANPSPQQHIAVNKIKILSPWQQPAGFSTEEVRANSLVLQQSLSEQRELSNEASSLTSLIAKVHAIAAEGKILVVEKQDLVLPIYVTTPEYTQNLYRGDIIKLAYQIQEHPAQPIHLQLDSTVTPALEVLDAIASWHNQKQTLTGSLVKFPQSPQLKFDVYAIEVANQGINRYFTLVNFQDIDEFENIRLKLAKIWDNNVATAKAGRNMLINPEVKIQAEGIVNILSPQQANPQILLDSAEQVQVLS